MKKSLELINERIYQAIQRRSPSVCVRSSLSTRLVAVSKYQPINKILEAYDYGQRHFGENYINELFDKSNAAEIQKKCQDIRWHFIGHLQKNKINKLLRCPNLYVLETVDSKTLAQLLNQACEKQMNQQPLPLFSIEASTTSGMDVIADDTNTSQNITASRNSEDDMIDNQQSKRLKVMLQVNTSGEEAKSGVTPEEVIELGEFVWNECKALELCGLMTIGKLAGWPEGEPNQDYLTLFQCREALCKHLGLEPQFLELSMGMSDGFEEAIEMGSTNIRVGTMIFGQRANTR